MNYDEPHTFHQVTASRPQLQHAESFRSSSAAYSSDYASDASSGHRSTGYETPPSRVSTPLLQLIQPQLPNSAMTLPRRPQPAAAVPAPLNVRQNENVQARPGLARAPSSWDHISPPTPGVDDTPYIRFAIEQLTFDEELMGRGRHPSESSDENPFYGALDSSDDYDNPPLTGDTVIANPAPLPSQPQPHQSINEPPQTFRFPRQSSEQFRAGTGQEMLVPADPPLKRHPLGFVPTVLRPSSLGFLVFLCLLIITGLIFSNVYALRNHGLYDYDGNATPRYFVFQYLPALLGMIIIHWLFTIQAAIYRTLPYISMSKGLPSKRRNRVLQDMPIHPANFILPDYRFFSLGEPLIGLILLVFWLMNFTIPLLGCLYSTQYYINTDTPRWRWTTVQGLGWFLMVLYLILIAAILYCIVRFRRRNSALMWDPTSLADMIILFQNSNVLGDLEQSEVVDDLRSRLPPRFCRLGYWTTTRNSEAFYAVGQANHPADQSSPRSISRFSGKQSYRSEGSTALDIEAQRYSQASSFARAIHSPYSRRWVPWSLHDSRILAWGIAAILLLIAFLVVSFVANAVQNGFFPLLNARTKSNGFSSANFLYSFLPGLLGMFLFLAWQPIDIYFRSTSPYANLSSPDGATAWQSLLQSYIARLPGIATAIALRNGDFKVAYVSLISLLAIPIPVLAGGVFTAQLFTDSNEVRMVASMPGYYALCVFLSVYAVSYLIIWPKRKRYLTHSINTITGNLSFLYASSLLRTPSIRNSNQIRTRGDLVNRLAGPSETGFTGDLRRKGRERFDEKSGQESRYAFGIFTGTDGHQHLGIDRLEGMLVTGTPGQRNK